MTNQFRTEAQIIADAEAEFGEPFIDILRGFARDKESIASTSVLLGASESWLYRWLARNQVDIEWPKLSECAARRAADAARGKSEAHKTAARENLKKAHEANKLRPRKTTPELMSFVMKRRERGDSWRSIAKIVGLNASSIQRCYDRYYSEDKNACSSR